MLSRSHRFHGYNALNWAYKHSETVRDPKLSLKYALNPRRSSYRAAVVISRKVSKSAVVRNHIRRRIYEAVRAESANITGGYDLIFSVFSDELAAMEAKELNELVTGLLKRAKAVQATP